MHLALYKYDSCGYCQRVMRAIDALGLREHIEMRDVLVDPAHRQAVVDARGRGTVPVLRIDREDGTDVEWMGESADIVAWLYDQFGEGDGPPKIDIASLHRVATMAMWALLGAGLFFREYQPTLWFVACLVGAARSAHNAWRTRGWLHAFIGVVFLFAAVSILLNARGVVEFAWWYAAYGLAALLALGALIYRWRLTRPQR